MQAVSQRTYSQNLEFGRFENRHETTLLVTLSAVHKSSSKYNDLKNEPNKSLRN